MSGTKPSGSQDQASDGQEFQDLGTPVFKNPKAGIWIRKEPICRGYNTFHCSINIIRELHGTKILP